MRTAKEDYKERLNEVYGDDVKEPLVRLEEEDDDAERPLKRKKRGAKKTEEKKDA